MAGPAPLAHGASRLWLRASGCGEVAFASIRMAQIERTAAWTVRRLVLGLPSDRPGQGQKRSRIVLAHLAAGVCTCVPIGIDVAPLSGDCEASDCCFVDPAGTCSCRLAGAAADCGALMEALNAAAPVATCPP